MDNVQCSGTERRLIDCPHITLHNCVHYEDVGVRCNETGEKCYKSAWLNYSITLFLCMWVYVEKTFVVRAFV